MCECNDGSLPTQNAKNESRVGTREVKDIPRPHHWNKCAYMKPAVKGFVNQDVSVGRHLAASPRPSSVLSVSALAAYMGDCLGLADGVCVSGAGRGSAARVYIDDGGRRGRKDGRPAALFVAGQWAPSDGL